MSEIQRKALTRKANQVGERGPSVRCWENRRRSCCPWLSVQATEGEGNEAVEGGGVCGNKIMLCPRKVDRKTKLLK